MYTPNVITGDERGGAIQNVTVEKAKAMLEVVASTPAAQLPADMELNFMSVGEIADLCLIQSTAQSEWQQEVKREEDSQRNQPHANYSQGPQGGSSGAGSGDRHHHHHRHHHHRHNAPQNEYSTAHPPDNRSRDGSTNNPEPEPSNYYYEPLNPYRLQNADKVPPMEEARLDIRMQKLYESLQPFGGDPPDPTVNPINPYHHHHVQQMMGSQTMALPPPTSAGYPNGAASAQYPEDHSSSRYSGNDSRGGAYHRQIDDDGRFGRTRESEAYRSSYGGGNYEGSTNWPRQY